MEGVVDVEGGQREVDRKRQSRVGRDRSGRECIEGRDELGPARGLDLEARPRRRGRRGGGRSARTRRGSRRGRAARRSGTTPGSRRRARPRRPPAGRDPRRASRRRARRSRPAMARGRSSRGSRPDPRRGVRRVRRALEGRRCDGRDRRPRLAHRLARQVAPGPVGRLELGGQAIRLRRGRRSAAAPRRRRTPPPCPAALIRGATANESVSTSTAAGATDAAARRAAIPGRGRGGDPGQPEPDDRPRLAEDRDEVGDAADRREVAQVERGRRPARLVGEQELGKLEGDAAARQAALRVPAVGPLRVDDRERRPAAPAAGGDGR